jgi:hypothetical protein
MLLPTMLPEQPEASIRAAADQATSYLQEAALVNDARPSGKAMKDVPTTTYIIDRQKVLGRLRALPWGSAFKPERQRMPPKTRTLICP